MSPALFTNIQSKHYSDLVIVCVNAIAKGMVDRDSGLKITECNLTYCWSDLTHSYLNLVNHVDIITLSRSELPVFVNKAGDPHHHSVVAHTPSLLACYHHGVVAHAP